MTNVFEWSYFLSAFSQRALKAGFLSSVLAETDAGPLTVWHRAGTGPRVYLSSGIHGDEPAGPLALLQLITEGVFERELDWTICPALNPTGLALGRRENSSGLDLNRDYLKKTSREIEAHVAWIESRPAPDFCLSLHEDWESKDFYLYEINTGSDNPALASAVIDAVSPWFLPESGPLIDAHVPRAPGWIFHPPIPDEPEGWPEAIFLAKYGCSLSLTLETPTRAPLSARVAAHLAGVRAGCRVRFS